MPVKTDAELLTAANTIKNETAANANTATRVGGMLVDMVDSKKNVAAYKEYVAILSQTGTGAPTAQVINNTIGAIVWTRNSAGNYVGTLAGAFVNGKTVVSPTNVSQNISDRSAYLYSSDADSINILVRSISTGSFSDFGQVDFTSVEIRVYS